MNFTEDKIPCLVDIKDDCSLILYNDEKSQKRTSKPYAEKCEQLGYFIRVDANSKKLTKFEKMAVDFHLEIISAAKILGVNPNDMKFPVRYVVNKRLLDDKSETYHSLLASYGDRQIEIKISHKAWLYLDLFSVPIQVINRLY